MPDFIFIAVVRNFHEAIGSHHALGNSKGSTENLLRDIFNHNINKRGFFICLKTAITELKGTA